MLYVQENGLKYKEMVTLKMSLYSNGHCFGHIVSRTEYVILYFWFKWSIH